MSLFRVVKQEKNPSCLGFQAVILLTSGWETACIYSPKSSPQVGCLQQMGWIVAFLWAYNWVFWVGSCRGRRKSRKPHQFFVMSRWLSEKVLRHWCDDGCRRRGTEGFNPHQDAGLRAHSATLDWGGKGKVILPPFLTPLYICSPLAVSVWVCRPWLLPPQMLPCSLSHHPITVHTLRNM